MDPSPDAPVDGEAREMVEDAVVDDVTGINGHEAYMISI